MHFYKQKRCRFYIRHFFFYMLKVAVIGGGPSGSCAAEILAKSGIKTWIFERKLDNAKPCGGAIPLCMVEEFDLPESIIDRKVRHMRMISPSNREVDISLDRVYGKSDNEFIGMYFILGILSSFFLYKPKNFSQVQK